MFILPEERISRNPARRSAGSSKDCGFVNPSRPAENSLWQHGRFGILRHGDFNILGYINYSEYTRNAS